MRQVLLVCSPVVLAAAAASAGPGARVGAEALGCVPQAEALGGMAQAQRSDVEDVLEGGGVRRVGAQERLQGCTDKRGNR